MNVRKFLDAIIVNSSEYPRTVILGNPGAGKSSLLQYLEKRPHSWRQQLCFRGRRLKAFDVWSDMIVKDNLIIVAHSNHCLNYDFCDYVMDYDSFRESDPMM